MPEFSILYAKEKDLPRIVRLAWEIWPEWYFPIIGPEQLFYMLDQLYQEEILLMKMQEGQQFYIYEKDGSDAGYFAVRPSANRVLRLENLYLTFACRGQGAGKAMLDKAAQTGISLGAAILQCNVNRFNPSTEFYLNNGFQKKQVIDIPFGPFFLNDFIMEKSLIIP